MAVRKVSRRMQTISAPTVSMALGLVEVTQMDAIYARQDIIQVPRLVSAMRVSQACMELRLRQAVQRTVHNAAGVNTEALVPVLRQITFAYFAGKVFLTT